MFVVDGTAHRILRATAATLTFQGRDSDGEPANPGTVTVAVASSDGTEIIAAGTSTTTPAANDTLRTVALTAAQTANLDVLYATWTSSGTVIGTTRHDIVGGYYFAIDDLRSNEPTAAVRPSAAELPALRAYVETLIEQATSVAFVPRFDVAIIAGATVRDLVLPRWYLRAVRWVRLWSSNEVVDTLSATEVAAIPSDTAGVMHLDRSTAGLRVEVGFEHGLNAPPADVTREAILLARTQITRATTRALPEAATSQRLENGTFVTLATPGVGNWHTGIPSVDDMIRRYARTRIGIA